MVDSGFRVERGLLSSSEVCAVLQECRSVRSRGPPAFRALGDAGAMRVLRESAKGGWVLGGDTVGHGLHLLGGAVAGVVAGRSGEVAREWGGDLLAQAKVVMKPAGGGRVPVHADEQYIYTDPPSGVALWIALDRADESNGRLEVLPGSHLTFARGPRFEFDPATGKAVWRTRPPLEPEPEPEPEPKLEPQKGTTTSKRMPFPTTKEEQDALPWVGIDAEPGDAVVFHHALLHRSAVNRSATSRRALTLHFVSSATRFPEENWIPAEALRLTAAAAAAASASASALNVQQQ